MLVEDVINLPGDNNPVLCTDGNLGMLLIYPSEDGLCGVQVHGEEDHRWIAAAELTSSEDGALRQANAPTIPPPSAQSDLVQLMLSLDWVSRGGQTIRP